MTRMRRAGQGYDVLQACRADSQVKQLVQDVLASYQYLAVQSSPKDHGVGPTEPLVWRRAITAAVPYVRKCVRTLRVTPFRLAEDACNLLKRRRGDYEPLQLLDGRRVRTLDALTQRGRQFAETDREQ